MHRTIESWKQVRPSMVVDGSKVQSANVLGMALDDLTEMAAALAAIMSAAEDNDVDACHEIARRALMVADLAKQPSDAVTGYEIANQLWLSTVDKASLARAINAAIRGEREACASIADELAFGDTAAGCATAVSAAVAIRNRT